MSQLEKTEWIPIMEPSLVGNELKYATEAIQSGWISSQGPFVTKFENQLAQFNGVEYALAVSNGTVALHLALVSLGIGTGDEVILPDLTFAASINSIIYTGAKPVLVDVDKDTFNIDPDLIKKAITPKTKAIMPVHLYGNPCQMDLINIIAKENNLFIIEDSAESIGSEFMNSKLGSLSDVGTFSFYGNKTITTGEGGAILFRDKKIYEKAKILRDHGMSPTKRYWHDYVGFNYRITNLQAAIGVAQMERIEEIISRKIEIAQFYKKNLKEIREIKFQEIPNTGTSTYWLVSIIIEDDDRNSLGLMNHLKSFNIDTRPFFFPLSEMPVYKSYSDSNLNVSKKLSLNGLSLPSFIGLSDLELETIVSKIKNYFNG